MIENKKGAERREIYKEERGEAKVWKDKKRIVSVVRLVGRWGDGEVVTGNGRAWFADVPHSFQR